jgi:hypothetical protein
VPTPLAPQGLPPSLRRAGRIRSGAGHDAARLAPEVLQLRDRRPSCTLAERLLALEAGRAAGVRCRARARRPASALAAALAELARRGPSRRCPRGGREPRRRRVSPPIARRRAEVLRTPRPARRPRPSGRDARRANAWRGFRDDLGARRPVLSGAARPHPREATCSRRRWRETDARAPSYFPSGRSLARRSRPAEDGVLHEIAARREIDVVLPHVDGDGRALTRRCSRIPVAALRPRIGCAALQRRATRGCRRARRGRELAR